MIRNVKLAFRTLFGTPFVTGVAVISLALGIGATSAIFSLTDQVLLQPLPVPRATELVNLTAPGPAYGSTSCNTTGDCDEIFSYPMFRDLEARQRVLSHLAAHRITAVNLSVRGEPLTGEAAMVSGGYFPTLEIQPALGRLLGPADDAAIGTGFVAVLGYDFWKNHFASNPGALNQTIVVNGKTFTIVGVAPRGFDGTSIGMHPVVYVPITMAGALGTGYTGFDNRRNYWIYLFGRRKQGVTIDQVQTALNAIYRPILNEVEAPLQQGMSEKTMVRFKAKEIGVLPGAQGQSQMHAQAKTPLAMLFGVTIVVLIIACANIANLLLARGAGRSTEMGVRLALGAGRRHLLAQLLTESVILALMGGVLSLGAAQATLKLLAVLLPPDTSTAIRFTLQPAVLLFTGALALATGVLFGLFPALHNTRGDLITAIRAGAGQITGHRHAGRFRASLVTVQIALATGLLICAGLFLRSLVNVSRVNLGVQVDDVITFGLSPRRSGFDTAQARALLDRAQSELARLPGVREVSVGMVPLINGSNWGNSIFVEGYPTGPDVDNNSRFNYVGEGYFRTLGMPILAGREFTEGDAGGAARVAVVNEAFAKKFNLGRNPVHRFMSDRSADSLNIEIVGLVKDAAYSSVKDSVPAVYFIPWRQAVAPRTLYFFVKTGLEPETQLAPITQLLKRIAPTVPIEDLRTMPQQIRESVVLDRLVSILSAVFAGLATILAAVGLYGVLAYTVQQRTREIGVRMALGAGRTQVRALVMRQVGVLIGIGGVLGIGAALGLGKVLRSLLFGLAATDPLVYTASLLMLAAVAMAATWVPVMRASRVNPVEALRYE